MRQEDFDRLSQIIADKGLGIDVLELLDNLQQESEQRKADAERLAEALTPSGETKAAYIGEFQFKASFLNDNDHYTTRAVTVPWITIKEIMTAIQARATLKAHERGEG